MECPNCSTALDAKRLQLGTAWTCEACLGVLLGRSVLDAQMGAGSTTDLWSRAHLGPESTERTCPGCNGNLRVWMEQAGASLIELDACISCELLWFDRGEIHDLHDFVGGDGMDARHESRSRSDSGWTGSELLEGIGAIVGAIFDS